MADDVGTLLLQTGLISFPQLETARRVVAQIGGTIPAQLVTQGDLDDNELTEFCQNQLLVPRVNPSQLARLADEVVNRLPPDMAKEYRSIPVAVDGEENLTLVMSDPSDKKAAAEIGFFLGCYIIRAIATQEQIAWCLAHYYDETTPLHTALQSSTGDGESAAEREQPNVYSVRIEPREPSAHGRTQLATSPYLLHEAETEQYRARHRQQSLAPVRLQRPPNQQPSPAELDDRVGQITAAATPESDTYHPSDFRQPSVIITPLALVPTPDLTTPDPTANHNHSAPPTHQRDDAPPPSLHLSVFPGSHHGETCDPPAQHAIRQTIRPTFIGVGAAGSANQSSSTPARVKPATNTSIRRVAQYRAARRRRVSNGEANNKRMPVLNQNLVTTKVDASPMTAAPHLINHVETAKRPPPQIVYSLREIDRSENKSQIIEALLDFIHPAFERSGFLALRKHELVSWCLRGCPSDATALINIDKNPTFADIVRSNQPFDGLLEIQSAGQLADDLDLPNAVRLLVAPVAVRNRVVGVLIGLSKHTQTTISEPIVILTEAAGEALARVITSGR